MHRRRASLWLRWKFKRYRESHRMQADDVAQFAGFVATVATAVMVISRNRVKRSSDSIRASLNFRTTGDYA